MDVDRWKGIVKKAVKEVALGALLDEAKSKKKTAEVTFPDKLAPQDYLTSYQSDVATVIFKLRGKSVNCLANRGSDGHCRLCKISKETQEHVINCPELVKGEQFLNLNIVYGEVPLEDAKVREIASRFALFEERLVSKAEKVCGDGNDD